MKKNYAGIAVITIRSSETDRYKAAEKTVTVTVSPAKLTISCKSYAKNRLTVKWTPLKYVTGYQIQYSKKSDFSGAFTKKITKASKGTQVFKKVRSGKKYYVRARSYVKAGKNVIYSKWSRKKSVKIR